MQLKEELMMQSNMKSFFLRRRRGGNYDGTSVRLTARQRFFTQRKLKKSVTLLLLLESITLCLKILQKAYNIRAKNESWTMPSVLKSTNMSHLNFSVLAFSSNFCPIYSGIFGNTL